MTRWYTVTNEIYNCDVSEAADIWCNAVQEFYEDLVITISAQIDKILLTTSGEDKSLIEKFWANLGNKLHIDNFNEIKEI